MILALYLIGSMTYNETEKLKCVCVCVIYPKITTSHDWPLKWLHFQPHHSPCLSSLRVNLRPSSFTSPEIRNMLICESPSVKTPVIPSDCIHGKKKCTDLLLLPGLLVLRYSDHPGHNPRKYNLNVNVKRNNPERLWNLRTKCACCVKPKHAWADRHS